MQNKELIECITREVLKILDEKAIISSDKKKLLLTDDIELNLSKNITAKYELSIFDKLEADNNLAGFENLIITELNTKLLLEVSELIQINPKAEVILKFLLQGKNVYVLTGGVKYYQYQQTSPETLYNKIMEAENRLRSFGIEFLTLTELEMKLNSNSSAAGLKPKKTETDSNSEYFLLDKKLIDYSIIKNMYERNYSKIEVPAKS
ncbi:MAG: hypothetical protein ACOCRV_02635, partial [bacterium]